MSDSKKSSGTKCMEAPKEWPKEVEDQYEPVRALGKGGFASVVLAKKKNRAPKEKDVNVAIKVVSAGTDQELGYAHREMWILQEISHPSIMRLIDYWESPSNGSAIVMALSYAKGPTLEVLLKKGGAPGLNFCRVTMAQLVDAVAYLHSHACLHRDIKPDNLVVTGASPQQDEVWDETEQLADFAALREKWHVTLVDFGFARALSKNDVEDDGGFRKSIIGRPSSNDLSEGRGDLNEALDMSASVHFDRSTHSADSSRSRSKRSLDRSYSRVMVRKMSALGNRNFAAPEVMKAKHVAINHNGNTLSAYVSDYGMVADAFSVGATIRYTLSGVPPDQNIQETISSKNSLSAKAGRWLGKKVTKRDNSARKKRYRSIGEFPAEASRLVKGLTHWNPKERTTVRTARLYPWIDDALGDQPGTWTRAEVEYLDCAAN